MSFVISVSLSSAHQQAISVSLFSCAMICTQAYMGNHFSQTKKVYGLTNVIPCMHNVFIYIVCTLV